MKPVLKAPGTERMNLKCDGLLSNFAFKFNLCRFGTEPVRNTPRRDSLVKLQEAVDELLLLCEEDINELLMKEGSGNLAAVGLGELDSCLRYHASRQSFYSMTTSR
jgi:hypothetical protein